MQQLSNYFKATLAEMKHVKWPTQKQAFTYTVLVIVVCAVVAVFVAAFDFMFSQAIDAVVNRF